MTGFKTNNFPCIKTECNIQWLCVNLKVDKADLSHDSLSIPSCIVQHLSLLCVINGDILEFTSIVQKQVSRLWCMWACTRAHREMLPYTQSPWVLCLSSFKWQQPCSYFALCNAHVVCLYTRNAANDPWPPHLTVAVEKQTNKRKSGTSKHVQNATVYFHSVFRMLKSV